jgi:Outer membrane protein beta-barrel domain
MKKNTHYACHFPWQKYHKTWLLLCLLIGLTITTAEAQFRQGQRFAAGLIAGVTASQIDGDISAGYHKVGLQGGLNVMAKLREKQAASVEILFTQRGCRNQTKPFPPIYFSTTLNYVEVPVQWHYFDWRMEGDGSDPDWYRAQFNIGLTYARLLGYQDKYEDGFGIAGALPNLERNSVCFATGASIFFNRHVGLTMRYHRAFNRLYKVNPDNPTGYSRNLWEHFLAFQLNYRF